MRADQRRYNLYTYAPREDEYAGSFLATVTCTHLRGVPTVVLRCDVD